MNDETTSSAPRKYPVQLTLRDGRQVVVCVPNPFTFIGALATQLNGASGNAFWHDPTGPLLLHLNQIEMAVAVAQE